MVSNIGYTLKQYGRKVAVQVYSRNITPYVFPVSLTIVHFNKKMLGGQKD